MEKAAGKEDAANLEGGESLRPPIPRLLRDDREHSPASSQVLVVLRD